LIRHYAAVAPHPVTTSLAAEVYRRMPNDTDFTIFRAAGIPGLNFAFIGSDEHYHQPSDDLAQLNLRSLEHHGAQALALARRFGDLPSLSPADAGNDVYFDLAGWWVIHYAQWLSMPLCFVAATLWLIALLRSSDRRTFRPVALAFSLISPLIVVGIASLLCWAVERGFPHARHSEYKAVVLCVMIAIAMTIPLAAFQLARRWISVRTLVLASAFLWLVLAVISAKLFPGGSYATLVPAMALAIGALGVQSEVALLRHGTWWMISLVIVIVLVPLSFMASQALSLEAAPAIMLLPALGAWSIAPALGAAIAEPRRIIEEPAPASQPDSIEP
jgi:hypothetical protein